ncbi:50S ribosomal protein L15 [Bifidobacterium tissieri]|uniref:Large ribosomal subunit protein uL15 n=1 Tax=Bifidobacterium tissieri TaxID=1630162 RepID=A0A261FI29_9BIFI|nr:MULTISPECIES: 50S ribosomal protein L15 [Bifidobacterium]OZG58821.1 50S ribosomal protein L15 [Bifidobacterium tissieri]
MTENNEEVTIIRMHDLRPAPGANKDRIRVGRGEGSKGKTSGRGTKGTKARYSVRPGFEGGQLPLYMRLPKLRGFKSPFKKQFQVVNLARLAELYPQGGEVTVEDLVAKGAVRKGFPVKVLGDGEVAAAFTLKGVKVSAAAKSKIEAAGGSVSEE